MKVTLRILFSLGNTLARIKILDRDEKHGKARR
jgi:hypothetical protein